VTEWIYLGSNHVPALRQWSTRCNILVYIYNYDICRRYTKLFQCISCEADSSLIEEDLTNINNWSSSDLIFNQSKCKVQTISRKRKAIIVLYSMENTQFDHCMFPRTWPCSMNLVWSFVESAGKIAEYKSKPDLGVREKTNKNFFKLINALYRKR
jgi:hypothetical protein